MSPLWRGLDVDAAPTGSLGGRGIDSIIGLAAQGLVRFGLTFAVGRLAGPAALGVFATGLAIAQMLILFWPTTSGQAASRFVARARGRGQRGEVHDVLAHLCGRVVRAMLVLALACIPLWLLADGAWGAVSPIDVVAGCVVGLTCAGLAGQAYTRGVHYGLGAVRRVVTLDIACSLAGLAGLVAALALGVRGVALLLPPALAYVVLTLTCWPWGVRGAASPELRGELDRFVMFGSLGTIASAGLIQFSLLASRAAGQAAGAGQYSAASSLALPFTLASGALSLVLYPALSEAAGRGDRAGVSSQLDRGFRGVLVLVVPAVAVMALLSRPLVAVVWGPQFELTARLLPILLLAVLANVAGVPCVNAITGATSEGIARMAAVSFGGLGAASVLWFVLVPTYGVPGVAIGYAAGVFLIAGYAVGEAWSRWRLRWGAPVALLLFAVLVIAAGPVLLQDAPWWWPALAAVVFLTLWAATHRRDIAWVKGALRR